MSTKVLNWPSPARAAQVGRRSESERTNQPRRNRPGWIHLMLRARSAGSTGYGADNAELLPGYVSVFDCGVEMTRLLDQRLMRLLHDRPGDSRVNASFLVSAAQFRPTVPGRSPLVWIPRTLADPDLRCAVDPLAVAQCGWISSQMLARGPAVRSGRRRELPCSRSQDERMLRPAASCCEGASALWLDSEGTRRPPR